MKVTAKELEIFFLILVRISAFVYSAPFFGMKQIPVKLKAGFSICISILLMQIVELSNITYSGVLGYAGVIIEELLIGLIIGFFANICSSILSFSGQLIDMEIGFSMVNVLDPVSNIQTTITGNLYSYLVMLMMIATNMHHYILLAIMDTYKVIPIGGVALKPQMYVVMVRFMVDYFIIGFRIVLPVFATILLVNIILAILAKVAPQMNMFVIGMQLKVLIGLSVLFFVIILLPSVSQFIFEEIMNITKLVTESMMP